MNTEAKKLHLIEELLKVESETVLAELEMVLTKSKNNLPGSKDIQDFTGLLKAEKADELERDIEEEG